MVHKGDEMQINFLVAGWRYGLSFESILLVHFTESLQTATKQSYRSVICHSFRCQVCCAQVLTMHTYMYAKNSLCSDE